MRRFLTFAMLAAALAVPATSSAHPRGTNDGTLSVRDGTGPIVTGDEWSNERNETTTTWGGTRVRFRIIGGTFRIVVKGRGINLSLVGKGTVTLNGAGTEDDGTYSVNGEPYSAIPDFPFPFVLSATSP
jgi:hypothetical protein